MKKLVFCAVVMLSAFSAICNAQGLLSKKTPRSAKEISYYLQPGIVPQEGREVVFTHNTPTVGKSKADSHLILSQWANLRYMPNTERGLWSDKDYFKNLEYAEVTKADGTQWSIVCKGYEEQVFSNRALAKDYAVFTYDLVLSINDNSVDATIRNIAYLYNLTDAQERIEAEDWITDKESLTKKGELNRITGKFRVRTIDLVEQLFAEIDAALSKL